MKTPWGEALDENKILPEYPRPQMARESCLNLNGPWDYAFTDTERIPDAFEGKILVPFSPECELSGVGRTLRPGQTLWYRRTFRIPEGFCIGRVLLHFGAVDQKAAVYVNGREVCSHAGGYTPFGADITEGLREENTLVVKVRDDSDASPYGRGKQKLARGGIWYTAQSGIWQTVWAESVPEAYIRSLRVTPLFDEGAVEITVLSDSSLPCTAEAGGRTIAFAAGEPAKLPLGEFTPWTPENPFLYGLTVTMGQDRVQSYFGMRKFSVGTDEAGIRRLFLNNRPYFQNGLLDQGYYCDGLYTAPSDEAMVFDIQTAKSMGYNLLRKHIKVEPLRWYYHCDRLGMLVWQDMVCGGGAYRPLVVSLPALGELRTKDSRYSLFSRGDAQGRAQYIRELEETVACLYNTVCVSMWVAFNEGWGQFDAAKACALLRKLDGTRVADHASGWYDQGAGEFHSRHVYFRKYRFRPDRLGRAEGLSEFGGYNFRVEGHCFNAKDFGYKKLRSPGELWDAFAKLYEEQIAPAKKAGLAAAVYTQLTDVEDELNGLITYDRKQIKLSPERVKALMDRIGR